MVRKKPVGWRGDSRGHREAALLGLKRKHKSKRRNTVGIYQQLKRAGVKLDHHESDLYAKVTPTSQRIVNSYRFKSQVKKFRSQIDGKLWFDIPFAYTPFWNKDRGKKDKRKSTLDYKVYHRRYPATKWDYKAVSTKIRVNGVVREVIYYTLSSKGKKSEGVEVYQGRNYIVDSSAHSYSRRYSLNKLPKLYKKLVGKLIIKHRKTRWSTASRVDKN